MAFSRTPSGSAAEYLFYKEILVYVEGYMDIPFYDAILQNYGCRIKARGGKEECKKSAADLVKGNYLYVVILDGDYEILERARSKHRRIILLHRYSVENYLFEEEAIEQFCRDRSHLADSLEKLVSYFQEVVEDTELKFKELIVLDVAHQRSNTGYDVLPNSPEQFLETQGGVDFQDSQIQDFYERAVLLIDEQSIENARVLVEKFLEKHRFIDLLPGHFAFGIMRCLIISTVNRRIRRNRITSDEDIRVPLSRMVWGLVKTPDHNSLKTRLCRAVLEAQKMPRPGKGIQN